MICVVHGCDNPAGWVVVLPNVGEALDERPYCRRCWASRRDRHPWDKHTEARPVDPARLILGDYEWRRNNLHLPAEQQSSAERAFRAGVMQAAGM